MQGTEAEKGGDEIGENWAKCVKGLRPQREGNGGQVDCFKKGHISLSWHVSKATSWDLGAENQPDGKKQKVASLLSHPLRLTQGLCQPGRSPPAFQSCTEAQERSPLTQCQLLKGQVLGGGEQRDTRESAHGSTLRRDTSATQHLAERQTVEAKVTGELQKTRYKPDIGLVPADIHEPSR